MKHLYLFNENTKASVYGIGTYIKQLTNCLLNRKDIYLHIVNLRCEIDEFEVVKTDSCCKYSFPNIDSAQSYYYRNIWFVLNSYIKGVDSRLLVFHLNYFNSYPLVKYIRMEYPAGIIVFTIHYFTWCFKLNGNTSYFRELIKEGKNNKTDNRDNHIISSFEEEKTLLNEVDCIICLSQYTKEILTQDYEISKKKINLIYNGLIDEAVVLGRNEKNKLRKELLFSKREKIILFVGRLDDIKGLDILINAFKIALKKETNARLVIVGDGLYSTYLNESKYYWSRIVFTGRLEKEDLYKFYQIADVGVMPSMHEQCSYVAIEMLMFNVPLILSTTTGLNEMLDADENKIKITEGIDNIHVSTDNLANLIVDHLKCNNINYRDYYNQKYTIQIMSDRMNTLYNSLLK